MVTLIEKEKAIQKYDSSVEQVKTEVRIRPEPDVAVQERSRQVQRRLPFPAPSWPTSRPGPRATYSLPGQKPMPGRTDQMVYESYDQERGRPIMALSAHAGRFDVVEENAKTAASPASTRQWEELDANVYGSIDISGASLIGERALSPAETGHYHYGPRGPGINTDASGSYAPYEVDPRGRPVDRPVKLYITK